MSTASIYQVCEMMEREGFRYGSMIGPDAFKRLEGASAKLKESWRKPEDAMYFSLIDESWQSLDSTSEMDVVLKTLQWHDWLVGQNWGVKDYSKKGLLFAKLDESRFISNSNPRFAKGGDFHVSRGIMSQPNWEKVGMEYNGIHVDPCIRGDERIFDAWDVDTVCIFRADVITEARWFENSGEDWTYDVRSMNF